VRRLVVGDVLSPANYARWCPSPANRVHARASIRAQAHRERVERAQAHRERGATPPVPPGRNATTTPTNNDPDRPRPTSTISRRRQRPSGRTTRPRRAAASASPPASQLGGRPGSVNLRPGTPWSSDFAADSGVRTIAQGRLRPGRRHGMTRVPSASSVPSEGRTRDRAPSRLSGIGPAESSRRATSP
jgi:hypothetical protein